MHHKKARIESIFGQQKSRVAIKYDWNYSFEPKIFVTLFLGYENL